MLDKILDIVRISLYSILLVLGLFLYQAWQREHETAAVNPSEPAIQAPATERYVPTPAVTGASAITPNTIAAPMPTTPTSQKGQLVSIRTDVLDVVIDTRGGDIIGTNLRAYHQDLSSTSPITLLNDQEKTRYLAESGLLGAGGPDTNSEQAIYRADQTAYQLEPTANRLAVILHWQKNGLQIDKIFTFNRHSYEVGITYQIRNHSTQVWKGNLYTQLARTDSPPPSEGGFINLSTYFGAAISTPQKPFEKIDFKQMKEKNLNQAVKGGWVAMIQHYFISAWVPAKDTISSYYTRITPQGLYMVGMIGPELAVAPGTTASTSAKLYTGPAIAEDLEKTAPGLKLTIDYGWFWFISDIIFWMMDKIHHVVGNWGWSIVIVTIIIKLLFYQLSAKSYRSMNGLKRLQPKMEALKERYKDDRQKMTQATLELYKQEKVNPMSGCLPILIQIPVFIALYWVLVESVQLRHAPFILWIHDLSQHDPYYILPVMMGISMFIQQRLNPPPPDPMQAKVMMLMPIIFTVLFANFPAGLMLYWFVNNTLSFLQQWYVMKQAPSR